MICPTCGVQFDPTYGRCPYCEVDLVAESSPQTKAAPRSERADPRGEPHDAFSPVPLLRTSDWGLLAIAQSMLASAEIPMLNQRVRGGAVLFVAPQDADDARAILADVIADAGGESVAHS